jgi:acyl carrier protein
MAIPITVEQWLIEQALPLLLFGFALLLGFVAVYLSARHRRASLLRARWQRTETTFVEELTGYGFDPEIARITYRYLQAQQNIAFPIEPLDDLDLDLGLDSEDLEQTIRDLLELTGREHLPGLLCSPLVTVGDLVRYLQASPRRNPLAA